MQVGIMQPYFFPYIGYWQLIYAVDKFVLLDDVNYIMRGYINRNSILLNGNPYRFTIPIKKASQNKLIMETKLNFSLPEKRKFLKLLDCAYKHAPYYDVVMPIIEYIILSPQEDLTKYIYISLNEVCKYLQIQTEILISSQIEKNTDLHGENRIIEICKKLHANIYINPCGGRKLYSQENFRKENIELYFLDTIQECIYYKQKKGEFVSNLSILDVMFYNNRETIARFLGEYELNQT
ncbi:MAG: WbqC family protein [Lachnospiraceae bacterium]|nr:WbqC family protein [Lachnospiraceae bacterium]